MPSTQEIQRLVAFSRDPHGGNPAGVVLDATGLSASEMQSIAAEIGYSETAFLFPQRDARRQFDIRYYSPQDEVAFCGHATIATAVAVAERAGPGRLDLHTRSGTIPIETQAMEDGAFVATLTSVPTSVGPVATTIIDDVLEALDWSRDDLDPELPPKVAYAGNEHLVLAAATRERLARLDYDFEQLGALMGAQGWTTVHLVWRESDDVFHARDPFPPGGVVEDPATGAAAAAFGGYLKATGDINVPAVIRIYQGEDMGRPSTIFVEVPEDDDRVRISGTATRVRTESD
jgi:PhzF family phenazine biosynthesis protein